MPRHTTEAVACPLGQVLDLSGTGMRVAVKGRCSLKVGQTLPLKLRTPHGSVAVAARIVWRKRIGLFGGHELGLNFDGIKPNQSAALATIAKFGFIAAQGVRGSDEPVRPGNAIHHSAEADIVLAPYFERLGLDPAADSSQIKHAYRSLARTCHPDVAPGQENVRRFMELREAYDLLIEHRRRAG